MAVLVGGVFGLSLGACGENAAAGPPSVTVEEACAAGLFVQGDEVVFCLDDTEPSIRVPSAPQAAAAFGQVLGSLGVDDPERVVYVVVPRELIPVVDATASYKPELPRGDRVSVVRLSEAFDTAADDGVLILTLIHEYGHLLQYLRGEPAGDELEDQLCRARGLVGDACLSAMVEHLEEMERDADEYMLNVVRSLDANADYEFNLWAGSDFFEAGPASPVHPPPAVRAKGLRRALEAAGLPEPPSSTPAHRQLLDSLAGFADVTRHAIAAQGGWPE
jgi:hypothetical protein